jgi:hypothetical protein
VFWASPKITTASFSIPDQIFGNILVFPNVRLDSLAFLENVTLTSFREQKYTRRKFLYLDLLALSLKGLVLKVRSFPGNRGSQSYGRPILCARAAVYSSSACGVTRCGIYSLSKSNNTLTESQTYVWDPEISV